MSDAGSDPAGAADGASGEGGPSLVDRDLVTTLQSGALAVALVFALVAAVGFYTSAQRVIQVWVAGPYRPVFTMGFNLVVLLAMVALVVVLTRRLTA